MSEADEAAPQAVRGRQGPSGDGVPIAARPSSTGSRLGFANVVRRGDIGCIGASGTGLQEVTRRLSTGTAPGYRRSSGPEDATSPAPWAVSRPGKPCARWPGTPGHASSSWSRNPPTRRSPPASSRRPGAPANPSWCIFSEQPQSPRQGTRIFSAGTLEEAASQAVALSCGGRTEVPTPNKASRERSRGRPDKGQPNAPGQRFIRGLYSGGTLAAEAVLLMRARVGDGLQQCFHAPGPGRHLAEPGTHGGGPGRHAVDPGEGRIR